MEWDCESLVMLSSKNNGSSIDSSSSGVYAFPRENSTQKAEKMERSRKGEKDEEKCVKLSHPIGSVEPLIGLRLGRRTYFENNNVSSSIIVPVFPKRAKPSSALSQQILRCQVDGCNLDLSSAKSYHQKHRVCDNHSKCPKVFVGGAELRFCQQCSRFHGLSEFDEMKRSCRRRLYHHNARRRNPRQQFNSTRPSSSFYDERQQMNTVVNKGQLVLSKTAVNSSWDSYSSKYTISDESTLEPEKSNSIVSYVPSATTAGVSHAWSWPFSSDGTTAEFFNQGIPELCALSLLSAPKFISSGSNVNPDQSSYPEAMLQEIIPHQLIMPLASSEYYWQWQQQPLNNLHAHHTLAPNSNNNTDLFPETQLFKAPCDTDFYFTAFK
ncbi:unnamed protein product [Cuscuta epithymum]|uniref:SBP-type domain-containing protein n=1 Tax=Cuscuta epithymum TaxID=186058 RepID=A0AAV0F2K6_9ASTE|nr:unnamed protein product [Cuscuta epithymum]CAH9129619.1 unnamed protein product [Cuscuta epithymum]